MPIISSAYGSDGSAGFQMSATDPFLLVTSTGSIYGGEHTSGNSTYYYDGVDGAYAFSGIDNAGQILGFNYGIKLLGTGESVVNERSGSITAYVNYGIEIGAGSITNYGTITSQPYGYGIVIDNGYSSITNFGIITGNIAFGGSGGATFGGVGGTVYGFIQGDIGDDVFDLSHQTVTGAITGGGGNDTISFGEASSGAIIDLITGYATTGAESYTLSGFDKIIGSNFADTVTASAAGSVIATAAGNDTVYGGTGNDTIDGGSGNDILAGGGGIDTVSYVSAGASVTVSLASQGQAQATGGSGSDTLSGFANLTGSSYADKLVGDGNANVIHGDDGDDLIAGGNGNDTIYGDGGNDTIVAGKDKNTIYGGSGDDKIVGGASGDFIEGDYGRDTLTGGGGSDTFVYNNYSDSTVSSPDLITDFVSGTDKIDISALHITANDKFSISSSGGYTYISVFYSTHTTADSLIKLTGTNIIKTSDVIWGTAPAAHATTMIDHAPTTAHADLAATLHAAALDHGAYR